ncbi:MAG: hypothetical protein K9K93_05615 [Acholeplasmataceae bacterium]|nr:hypothetical protein [Acholeplasmataceae bacterium]
MKLSTILGFKRLKRRLYVVITGTIITGILSLLFALITFYGQEAGNFVLTIDPEAQNRGIELSNDVFFTFPTDRLVTDPVTNARDITYNWLKLDEIMETDGMYTDPDYVYVAFTFYLRNSGAETVDVSYYIRIQETFKAMDEAVRFLIIEDDEIERMYMKPDIIELGSPEPEYYNMPEARLWLSDRIVFREIITNFTPGQVKKFSLVVWLEGQDPDTTDAVLGGMLKAFMNFSIDLDGEILGGT